MRLGALGAFGVLLGAAACDGGLEPDPVCGRGFVGACGTAHYADTLPDSTDAIFVVAFPTFPQRCADLLAFPPTFRPFPPFALPRPYSDSAAYALPLPADRYEWVVAVWKKQGSVTFSTADTALFRVAGDYRDPADTAQRGVVTVPTGAAVGDIDFVVDFGNLRPVSSYVACASR
ncbi:MAG TPA: hypothetical protein VGQ06_13000 [Gemmatimonadales bacterium]|jgi:hypothetical protein|nr:hypothetical protein [Gemmatimonadales bacterium]